jgi:hypothetical protein
MFDSFKSIKTIESIYTGGKVVITEDAKHLITTLNEDIIVTELDTGKQVHELEGVRIKKRRRFAQFFCPKAKYLNL